ncbi:hypothetical protein ILUMI_21861 [Ignelater luminosus]|uniref:Acyltransferase 3 domain-containing protein n=1 Tax=Ignelater luminosus TaxID=2038154 RepID=A0A8K0CDR8_IGNLU|nr:hypothetical protein ILUMI_21861 [Ignelater luminosus]
MGLVVAAHTTMAAYAGPILNPQYFEKSTESAGNMIFVNGGYSIQSYFLMAGWLLSYHFLLTFEKQKDARLSYVILAFFNRYIRLTPVLLIMVLLSGTWLPHFGRGPFWDRIVGMEYRNCRKNGWSNLLYINNFYDSAHMCMQQTWYIAADTQLFLLSLGIVMLMWKYQRRIKLILGTFLIIGILIPGIIHYVHDYDIVIRVYPEIMKNGFLDLQQWHDTYIPFYTNIGGYVIGMMFGYLFYKRRDTQYSVNKFHVVIWWFLTLGLPLGIIFVGVPAYKDDYQHSRILATIYQSLARSAHAFGIGVGIFGTCKGIGWLFRDALLWSPTQVLGRLSFCAYFGHGFVIRTRAGYLRTPLYVNFYTLLVQFIGDLAMSYIFALILCLFVELPVAALQRLLIPQMEEKRKQEDVKKKLK